MRVALSTRTRIALTSFSLLCVSLLLTAYSIRHPQVNDAGSMVVTETLRPVFSVTHSLRTSIRYVWDSYINLINVADENVALKERLREVDAERTRLLETKAQNERLKSLLNAKEQENLSGIAAEVIGYDPSSWVKGVLINRGRADGVERGMAVVDGAGVVGQIVAAGLHTAHVLLITDHSSGVDALVQSSRVRGVVEGSGGSICELRYVSRDDQVKEQEQVVTSGMDGIFPKGLIIGTVERVEKPTGGLFQMIELNPAVDFSKLEDVLVLAKANEDFEKQSNILSKEKK